MSDNTCYIERSAVRALLISSDANNEVTRDLLAEVDKFPITTFADKDAEIEHLWKGYEDIKAAAVAGRVCDDVAWFDTITTLYDFCDLRLNNGKLGVQQSGSETP